MRLERLFRVVLAATGLAVAVGSLVLARNPARNQDWSGGNSGSLGFVLQTFAGAALPALLYVAAGLIVLARQPGNRVGPLLVATGFAQPTYLLVYLDSDVAVAAGVVLYDVSAALVLHLMLAWPSGRLPTVFDRHLVVAVYVFALLARTSATGFFDEDLEGNPFLISAAVGPDVLVTQLVTVATLVLVASALTRLVRRWRGIPRGRRRVMSPVVVGVPFLVLLYGVAFPLSNLGNNTAISVLGSGVVWLTAYGALPAVFLYAALQLRRARGSIRATAVDIGALPTVPHLETVLRQRLKDPAVQVLRWSPAAQSFVDRDGVLVREPTAGRSFTVLEEAGAPVAAVVHDPLLEQDPGLVSAISGAVRLALDGARLRDALEARGGDPTRLPEGEVTLLFADVEGSTALLEAAPEHYADLLAELRKSATDVVRQHGGELVDARGDELFAAFADPRLAVAAALSLRARTVAGPWPGNARVRLRIGLHRGTPQRTSDGYVGMDVHVAARVMSVGRGDEILASERAIERVNVAGLQVEPLGAFQLAGIRDAMPLTRLLDGEDVRRQADRVENGYRSPGECR